MNEKMRTKEEIEKEFEWTLSKYKESIILKDNDKIQYHKGAMDAFKWLYSTKPKKVLGNE